MANSNKRAHYRILYSHGSQPIFECAQGKFLVLDVSESGFRFVIKTDQTVRFNENMVLDGKIIFPEKRGFVRIKGKVLRATAREVAAILDEGNLIPLSKIMEEQRILIKKGKLSMSS